MIKLIATDLDGTLFYPKKKIRLLSRKNRTFLKRFLEAGNHVVLVSGRNVEVLHKLSKKMNHTFDMIGCNGGFISIDGKIVEENYLTSEEVRFIYDRLKQDNRIKAWLIFTNKVPLLITYHNIKKVEYAICAFGMWAQGVYKEKYEVGDDKLEALLQDPDCHFYKLMPYFGFRHEAKAIAKSTTEELQALYGDRYEILWSNDAIEIMKNNTNKANALKKVLNVLKLEEAETVVIGDSGNDIPLFEAFENSFVMEQAPDSVKEKAKHVVKGVYEIEKYL